VTVGEALSRSAQYLAAKGVDSPRLDAELLVAKALDRTRLELYTEHGRALSEDELGACRALIERRGKREPIAYILGEWGFRRLMLKTDRRALIPRPETEVVVDRCLEHIRGVARPAVLDVGTGSGAIALAIADEHPGARVTGFDNSTDALDLARENLDAAGLGERVHLLEHDLTRGFGSAEFDLVVSNPPYVDPAELPSLQPEIREWEPRGALVGGIESTRLVANAAKEALRPGAWLVVETAEQRAPEVAALLEPLGYDEIEITVDLAGKERVVEGKRP
jgi:release factor glutamine methyltransferase